MESTLNTVMRPSGFALIDVTYHTPKASPSPSESAEPSAPASAVTGSAVTCALVSAADLQSVAGAASVKLLSEIEVAPGLADCEWQLNQDIVVAVNIATGPEGEGISGGLWAQYQAKPAVSGVGSEAHWDATLQHLMVKFDTGYAQFAMVGPGVNDSRAAAIGLAKLVVPKLGG